MREGTRRGALAWRWGPSISGISTSISMRSKGVVKGGKGFQIIGGDFWVVAEFFEGAAGDLLVNLVVPGDEDAARVSRGGHGGVKAD